MVSMTCKFRHFLALVLSVGITSFVLCILGRDQPVDIQTFVTQTHKHLETLKENLQSHQGEKKLEVDDKYLNILGFNRDPKGTTIAHRPNFDSSEVGVANGTLPIIIVSSVNKGQLSHVEGFLQTVQSALPNNPVVLWNTELSSPNEEETSFSMSVKQLCNSSKCWVERFNYEDYPEHVKDLSLRAYRPIVIQTMLDRGGCVLWLDIERRLLLQSRGNLGRFLNLAMNGGSEGIVGWSSGHPTSSLTHPKMFSFFQTEAENYYFHRMIDPAQLLVCNTNNIHTKVMRPWVACTLIKDCISPFGSQSGGCRFDKKPLYRYSGCHAYDSAALNVALGVAFPLHQPYVSRAAISRPAQLRNQTASV